MINQHEKVTKNIPKTITQFNEEVKLRKHNPNYLKHQEEEERLFKYTIESAKMQNNIIEVKIEENTCALKMHIDDLSNNDTLIIIKKMDCEIKEENYLLKKYMEKYHEFLEQ